jgi:nucleoside-diphosphate-sugar epimerase
VSDRIEVVTGDIRDAGIAAAACAGVDAVVHLAAIASVQRSIEDPDTVMAVNTGGTLCLLRAARDAGVRRFVLASTAAVYGSDGEQPRRETMLPAPESPYAASKLAAEHLVAVWGRLHDMETVVLRFFNVFGPRQDPASPYVGVLSLAADALARGGTFVRYGDGEQTRDFVAVANVAGAILLAVQRPEAEGRVLNIGSGAETTLNEALAVMQAMSGRHLGIEVRPARPGDVRRSAADISAARELGYRPLVDFRTGCSALLGLT